MQMILYMQSKICLFQKVSNLLLMQKRSILVQGFRCFPEILGNYCVYAVQLTTAWGRNSAGGF